MIDIVLSSSIEGLIFLALPKRTLRLDGTIKYVPDPNKLYIISGKDSNIIYGNDIIDMPCFYHVIGEINGDFVLQQLPLNSNIHGKLRKWTGIHYNEDFKELKDGSYKKIYRHPLSPKRNILDDLNALANITERKALSLIKEPSH